MRADNDNEVTLPAYVFARDPETERAAGLVLAGRLVVDHEIDPELLDAIMRQVVQHCKQAPEADMIVGWHGARPDNINDDAVMMPWGQHSTTVEVRVAAREASHD